MIAILLLSAVFVATYAQDEFHPSALLISPVPRKHTPTSISNVAPCSGTEKGFSHLLAEPGSLNPISWKVDVPD
jgi:hypothetical protein